MCPLRKVQLISQQATSRIHRRRKCESSSPNYLRPIHILFWEYLGVMYMFQTYKPFFLQEKEPATLSHGQVTHSAKIALIVWPEIPQMPHKISAQFVCPCPKVSNFEKKLSLGVSSPCDLISGLLKSFYSCCSACYAYKNIQISMVQ